MSDGLVSFLFGIAFVVDIIILIFAINFARRQGTGGYLSRSILFSGLSAIALGIHHVLEGSLQNIHLGKEVAETVEAVASALLTISVFYLYKLVSD